MLTGPEEIFFSRVQKKKPEGKMFIENSMKRSRASGAQTASSNMRLEPCFRADLHTVKTSRYPLERKKRLKYIFNDKECETKRRAAWRNRFHNIGDIRWENAIITIFSPLHYSASNSEQVNSPGAPTSSNISLLPHRRWISAAVSGVLCVFFLFFPPRLLGLRLLTRRFQPPSTCNWWLRCTPQ